MPKIRECRRKWLPTHIQHNYSVCLPSLFLRISSIVKLHTFNALSLLLFCVYPVMQSAKHSSLCQPTGFQSTHRMPWVLLLVYGASPRGRTWSGLWCLSGYICSNPLSFMDIILQTSLIFGNWQINCMCLLCRTWFLKYMSIAFMYIHYVYICTLCTITLNLVKVVS